MTPTANDENAPSARGSPQATTELLQRIEKEIQRRKAGQRASFAQERIWFLQRLFPADPTYNVYTVLRLKGALNQSSLRAALSALLNRHQILLSVLNEQGGELRVDRVLPQSELLEVDTASPGDLASQDAWAASRIGRPFDLGSGPLYRFSLLRLGPAEHVLLLCFHHIVFDRWSLDVLARDLSALYSAGGDPEAAGLPPLAVQYSDYAGWQRSGRGGSEQQAALAHWRRRLAGAPFDLALATDRPRPARQSYRGGRRMLALDAPLLARARALAERTGATLFMVLLSVFYVLLYRETGQATLLVGTPVSNRDRRELEDLIGVFLNTLVLRADLRGEASFVETLAAVREGVLTDFEHMALPFESLVETMQPERDLTRHPIFQVMFMVLQESGGALELPGLEVEVLEPAGTSAKFDLTLSVLEGADGVRLSAEYSSDLFDAARVDRLLARYRRLLEAAVSAPEQPIGRLPVLPEAERRAVLAHAGAGRSAAPADACLHALVARQAKATPDAPALRAGTRRLSYRALDRAANQLAQLLRSKGAGPETVVALAAERSCETIVAILACLKAGAAVAPLDPSLPTTRLEESLAGCGARLLLTDGIGQGLDPPCLWMSLSEAVQDAGAFSPLSPDVTLTPDAAAFVFHTSGSSGRPKAVVQTHGCLENFVWHCVDAYDIGPGDRVLQFAPIGFDTIIEEVFPTLAAGGELVLRSEDCLRSVGDFLDFCSHAEITVLDLPTAFWQVLARDDGFHERGLPPTCRLVLIGGEEARRIDLDRWASTVDRQTPLINTYGPTEAGVVATAWRCRAPWDGAQVPIGTPIHGVRAYVLDDALYPVGFGVAGELCLAGACLARGYLGQPDLTAERFRPDPFGAPGDRLYRTGDRVRRLEDGTLVFLGRSDDQVKIRGMRVEPAEVETVLRQNPALAACAVVARADKGETALAAYCVARDGTPVTADALRRHASDRLPPHMVPATIDLLADLPLTPSGKIDRRALPAPRRTAVTADHRPPATLAEALVAAIWSDVLGREAVGATDNFFDLGGHSLRAIQVMSRLQEAFGRQLPLMTLFEAPTVRALAQACTAESTGSETAPETIPPHPENAPIPLSFQQERLWILNQIEPGRATFNFTSALRLRGRLDDSALATALSSLVARHGILRTAFVEEDGVPEQLVLSPAAFAMGRIDLTDTAPSARLELAQQLAREEAALPFDLTSAIPFRVTSVRLAKNDHVLLVTLHHIACDGWSLAVLVDDLAALYAAARTGIAPNLPTLETSFADYAAWQRAWIATDEAQKGLDYWRAKLKGDAPTLRLQGRRDDAAPSGVYATIELPLGRAAVERLMDCARSRRTTTFVLLVSALQSVLHRLTGSSDLRLGVLSANRTLPAIERTCGLFVNTIVLASRSDPATTNADLLSCAQSEIITAFNHSAVPFEHLAELMASEGHDVSRLFHVLFVFQNLPSSSLHLDELEVTPFEPNADASRTEAVMSTFGLVISATEQDGDLLISTRYDTGMYEARAAETLTNALVELLDGYLDRLSEGVLRPREAPNSGDGDKAGPQ